MTFIDTHTHLYLSEFANDRTAVMERALAAGMRHMVLPNVDLTTLAPLYALHSAYPHCTHVAMGLHPTEVGEDWENTLAVIEAEVASGKSKLVAIGEIGIDLYWDKTYREEQMEVFRRQIELAIKLDLPIIIHCRDGLPEVLNVLRSCSQVPRGVFHSFGGTVEDVEAIRAVGDFYFGINGIVSFKNSKLREVLPAIGIERILLETDAPYLAPVPHRGKRNESAYLIHTADVVADSLNLPIEVVADVTTKNACELFGIR